MNQGNVYDPKPAMTFAAVVYGGVVVAGTTLFISFVLSAFPPDAYLSRLIMIAAGVLIGCSAIAFPYALHTWTIEKTHRTWTTAFYYGEIAIMAVNVVVSFVNLLSLNTGYAAPEWAILYEPFSVVAIVYTLAAWGTVFLLDPTHKMIQQARQLKIDYEKEIAGMRSQFLKSIEGQDAVASAAAEDIAELLREQRNGARHFGSRRSAPAPVPPLAVDPGQGFVERQAVSRPLPNQDERDQ